VSVLRRAFSSGHRRGIAALACAGLSMLPMAAVARDGHAMHSMTHMEHAATPATAGSVAAPMPEQHQGHPQHPQRQHGSPAHGMAATSPAPQSDTAGARSPDYSDGIPHGSMTGMDMADDQPLGMLLFDRLERTHDGDARGAAWDVTAWYGGDIDKLWLRSEGGRSDVGDTHGDAELLWSRAAAAFWDVQAGARQDFGHGPGRTWAAFGLQGLAPYWFEVQATAYVGASGRTAARFRAEYDMRLTQRLILQPELEVDLYGKDDPARRIGSGLSELRVGLRLRYEIRRRFAPYVGVTWSRRHGGTADYARQDGTAVRERQFVAGVRFWF
jgi:copper resistance protein B